MKIIATSDFHGYLPTITEPFDLLLIAGDICPATDHRKIYQGFWLRNEFMSWLKGLPYANVWSKVIYVPGNHDFVMEYMTSTEMLELEHMSEGKMKILRHDLYEFEYPVSDGTDTLTIFGTPYCTEFGHWAFMKPTEILEQKFSVIPEGIDILVSHDSPNIHKLGAILEGPWKNDNTGSAVLAKHIKRIHPKLFVSGHFHSGNHNLIEDDGILMANVSYVNEDYYPQHEPLVIEYDEENRKFVS